MGITVSYSFAAEQEFRSGIAAGEGDVRDLLELLSHNGAGEVQPTLLLARDDGSSLSLAARSTGEVYLVWIDAELNSWSTAGGEGRADEDVAYMFFGTYSEARGDQFVPREPAVRAAGVFMRGGSPEQSGLRFEPD